MSQTAQAEASTAPPSLSRVRETGARLLEKLDEDRHICSNCFSRVRHPHESVDQALGRKAEGTLLKMSATSSPDPATYSEVVPPTSLPCDPDTDPHGREQRWQAPRSKTICECGQIDRPETPGPRSARERREAIVNVAERCREDDRPFDTTAAHAALAAARERPSLGGRHRDVLEMAVGFGLLKAD